MRLPAPALTALAAAALVALTACGGDDQTVVAASPSAAPTSSSPSASASPTAVRSASPSADTAQVVTLTVAAGKVTGDSPRVKVPLGSKVRVTVTSDVVDEVHVHGYDLRVDTVIGSPVQVEFLADKPGTFEVELEESKKLLTRLQVA